MLPTFVIGLREGVEAALIVGIIAAFLCQDPRGRGALKWMWIGVAAAVGLCVVAGVALELVNSELPHREQEGLESIIAALAVGAVTFMIVWMRRHARSMSGDLRASAGAALVAGSSGALVAMAFFAVIREGLETVVFLLAAFQSSTNPASAGFGALLGVLAAVGIGTAIYRGGVKLNLARFFRATGVVLVFVAAGLVASALHTAHEAGWLNAGQAHAVDLSWLVVAGTWTAALLTGMLGLQPHPAVVEVAGYVALRPADAAVPAAARSDAPAPPTRPAARDVDRPRCWWSSPACCWPRAAARTTTTAPSPRAPTRRRSRRRTRTSSSRLTTPRSRAPGRCAGRSTRSSRSRAGVGWMPPARRG